MISNIEQHVEDLVNARWDAGTYDQEFDKWCNEEMIYKDDRPDYIDEFLQIKFNDLIEDLA